MSREFNPRPPFYSRLCKASTYHLVRRKTRREDRKGVTGEEWSQFQRQEKKLGHLYIFLFEGPHSSVLAALHIQAPRLKASGISLERLDR
jgi:hypothetical protein